MESYLKILIFLSKIKDYNYADISSLDSDISKLKTMANELKKLGYISIQPPGVYYIDDKIYGDQSNLDKIMAKILLPGLDFLNKNENKNSPIFGINNNVLTNGGSISGNTFMIDYSTGSQNSPKIINPIEKQKTSWFDNINIIVGIISGIAAIIAIYQFFIKILLKN